MNTTVLVVEDEGLIALDMKHKLEQAGYSVSEIVDSADDAIASVERLQPSLVMMDIRLHGPKDGIEAAAEIRSRFNVPVIFVTAHADHATLERARITEPFGYIVKPFQTINFRAQIEMALWKHKMEQKLRVSERWFAATFQSIADALIATDRDGNVAYMNQPAADLTGWESQDATGRALADVFGACDEITGLPAAPGLYEIFDGTETGSMTRTFRLTRQGNGEPVLVEAEISANRDQGTMFGIVVVFRDITARRALERQERQTQRLSALALMATGLGRELADSQNDMDASLKHLIEQSRGSMQRLLWDVFERSAHQQSIVQRLITLGKSDTGQVTTVDINEVLTGLTEKFRKTLGVRRPLHLNLQPEILAIRTDSRNLRENLVRLIADTRQATPEGGPVTISTITTSSSEGKPVAQIVIRDTRKTVRPDAGERVFDPYYQSRSGSTNPGFSLALVYHYVALSGGTIHVENLPGEGSAYWLNFPAAGAMQAANTQKQELAASA
jgi:two-component system cell cycle sensor histidine kinase/response regulator CckA